jgi:hypothetical protein
VWDKVLGERWDLLGAGETILVARLSFTDRGTGPLKIITASAHLIYNDSFPHLADYREKGLRLFKRLATHELILDPLPETNQHNNNSQ